MCVPMEFKMKCFEVITVALLLRTPVYMTQSVEPVFVVTKNRCITNSESGIVFNPPVDEVTERTGNTSSRFYPDQQKEHVCNIEYDEDCSREYISDDWCLIHSVNGEINDEVFDRRWEEFRIYKSRHLLKDETLLFKEVLNIGITKTDFVIPFSVRLENEGHVFLCEDDINNSNCYWIMLEAWAGKKSALRRCNAGYIPTENKRYPNESCSTLKAEFHHTEKMISDEFWTHFKISVKNGTISVKKSNEESELLNFNDDNPFSPRRIFVHSKKKVGLWKFHTYTYLYSTTTSKRYRQLGKSFTLQKEVNYCMAFFVIMCSECELMITVAMKELTHVQNVTTKDQKWKEVKIFLKSNKTEYVGMYFTSKNRGSQKPFWGIDSVRQCADNEYRILSSSTDNVPCQLIANDKSMDTRETNEIRDIRANCSEDTFGENCIPCSALDGSFCPSFKYCELYENKTFCHCTSGFHTESCSEECISGYYGHGCKKQCNNCVQGCDNINGNCKKGECFEGFRGTKCDDPVAPLLKYAPGVMSIAETSCIVYIQNDEVIGDRATIKYIRFEYKRDMDNKWKTNSERDFLSIEYITDKIYNLEADTTYYVRAVLYSNLSDIYEGGAIKQKSFVTTCIPYNLNNINIKTYNTTATVQLVKKSAKTCRISNYKYSLDEGKEKDMKEEFELPNLKPFRTYKLTLRHVKHGNVSISFKTKEGVPSKVEKLETKYSSSTTILLEWNEPLEPNGIVTYNVRYKMQKVDCSYSFSNSLNVSTTQIYLPNVKPYSIYEIEVRAQTSQAAGEYSQIKVKTNYSESLSQSELPKIKVKDTSSNKASVSITPAKCEDIQGPIYLNFVAKCEYCHKKVHNNITTSATTTSYDVRDLYPYINYNLDVSATRNHRNWIFVTTEDFTTKPSVPTKTDEMYVVSKDGNSISLRWKPPPPTGILAEYKIFYNTGEMKTNITQCSLWTDYHCATIKNMVEETNYEIKVYARNEQPSTYSQIATSFHVTTKIDVPHSPYDVITTWTDNNDLSISWKHPNVTNGKIKKFTINFKPDLNQNFSKEIKSENDYNLTYTYLIQKKHFTKPCTKYNVSVTVHNEQYQNESNKYEEWSPPPVHNISNNTIKITNDTNHTIFIEISKIEDDEETVKNCSRMFYILTSSSTDKEKIETDINIFEKYLKNNSYRQTLGNIKQHVKKDLNVLPYNEMIYTNDSVGKVNRLYIYFVNECYGKIEIKKVEKNPFSDPEVGNKGLYALILLILLVPLIVYIYLYKIKKKQTSERSLMSIIKPQRRKDIEEVPLSENDPAKSNNIRKSSIKQKTMLPLPASYVLKTKFSEPVKIIDFESYVRRAIETGELEKQHENFPRGQTKPWEYGALKVNKSKNRYNNLIAYDHTRVKLAKVNGNEYSDYINANYIDGYRVRKAYIATQGPKSTTLNDFWRMIWQEKVKNIVMLANVYEGGKKKVEKYWPNINEEIDFNGIRVQYVSSKVYANYEYRVFKVYNRNEQREVDQLHFTTWPDHGVPLYSQSLVPFLQQMLKIPNNPQSPVLVHCSAGVGRTGTIILCDICLRMAAGEGSIDFLANLEHLRSQRPNMVDNVEQYKLAHLVVLECLFGMHTSVPCDENMNKAITKILSGDSVANQLRYLSDTEWEDRAMDTIWSKDNTPVYPEKNRFEDIVPDKNYQIRLKYYPHTDESSSYINAVQVDGFRSPGRFIVTQQPLPNTVGDFWRMVWERQCTVIVSLNEIDRKNMTSCRFWPEKGSEMTPVDYLRVSCINTKELESYRIISVEMINKKENESMEVKIISMRDWMPSELLPTSIENFLTFWEECDILSRKSDTVIVTCYDGATASGLYIASTFLIDKMKLEQECDVCLAVRTIRHNRKQFVASEEQFTFLYRVGLMYIEGFESYANFS